MIIFNGFLCLVAAIVLLIQLYRNYDKICDTILAKAAWLYWTLLMLIAIHHLFSSVVDPWLATMIGSLGTITEAINGILGFVLAYFISTTKKISPTNKKLKQMYE